MSIVLSQLNKDNSTFTVFENDQVLTADQLNDLFNYLDAQTRLTRTKMIGVGIICGLEIYIEGNNIILTKGAAVTTDGDLLYYNQDVSFTSYVLFNDDKANYSYFKPSQSTIPLYELLPAEAEHRDKASLATFERSVQDSFSEFVALLYLEDYLNDPDLCTGTDCDNKGTIIVREPRVLLIHKRDVRLLLESLPKTNQAFFGLKDLHMPRVKIGPGTDKQEELQKAFSQTFSVKEEIKKVLAEAYSTCSDLLRDDFEGADPTKDWAALIDQYFNSSTSRGYQYLYDFAKDIVETYNEFRDSLFVGNTLCCPEVHLFPKHILLGTLEREETRRGPGIRFTDTPLAVSFPGLLKRFTKVFAPQEYRHQFYPSPALDAEKESIERARFLFMRLNAMIRNFVFPETGTVRITPSHFNDQPLGKRSIPIYYRYNRSLPVHYYWDFESHSKRKETSLLSYHASAYSGIAAVTDPLNYDILPYEFFRIEGHIGMKYEEAERIIEGIISQNNLPIRVISLQVEKTANTVKPRQWYFPQLHLYEHFVRQSLIEHLNQVEIFHDEFRQSYTPQAGDPPKNTIETAMDGFKSAKDKVVAYKHLQEEDLNVEAFKNDVHDTINATANVKTMTKRFGFSNASTPHDFVINTDVLPKTLLLADLSKQFVDIKKNELILGNFVSENPGAEHACGCIRGGTFILVYTSRDEQVVADFMLPYSYVDKDIQKKRPEIKPTPKPRPKFNLPKLFEQKPIYIHTIDDKIKGIDDRYKELHTLYDSKFKLYDERSKVFDDRSQLQMDIYKKVMEAYTLPVNQIANDKILVGGKDVTKNVNAIRDARQKLLVEKDPQKVRQLEAQLEVSVNEVIGTFKETGTKFDAAGSLGLMAVAEIQAGVQAIQSNDLRQSMSTNFQNFMQNK